MARIKAIMASWRTVSWVIPGMVRRKTDGDTIGPDMATEHGANFAPTRTMHQTMEHKMDVMEIVLTTQEVIS